jgi:hypothetical protein
MTEEYTDHVMVASVSRYSQVTQIIFHLSEFLIFIDAEFLLGCLTVTITAVFCIEVHPPRKILYSYMAIDLNLNVDILKRLLPAPSGTR